MHNIVTFPSTLNYQRTQPVECVVCGYVCVCVSACVFSVVTVPQNTHIFYKRKRVKDEYRGYPQTFVRIIYSVVHFSVNTRGNHYNHALSSCISVFTHYCVRWAQTYHQSTDLKEYLSNSLYQNFLYLWTSDAFTCCCFSHCSGTSGSQ